MAGWSNGNTLFWIAGMIWVPPAKKHVPARKS
jgi:hypothetical protein